MIFSGTVRKLGLQLVLQLVLSLLGGLPQLLSGRAAIPAAQAQPRRADAAATAASQPHISRAQAAIEQKDWRLATTSLTQAFAIKRRADVLYYLGLVALGQQRVLEAQDLMRRYLADPARIPDETAVAEAQRVISLTRPPSGQVVVLGEAGALLWIDDRLVGDLPLSHPLLLAPGDHRVALSYKTARQESPVLVQNGRVLEMRFKRGTGAVLISLRPAVLFAVAYKGIKGDAQNLLHDAAEQGAQAQQQALLDIEAALLVEPSLGECRTTLRCQRELARKNQLEHSLDVSISRREAPANDGPWQLAVRLFHTEVEQPAAVSKKDCAACTPEQAAQLLKEATREVLAQGLQRHPATLSIESVPDGAEVLVDGAAIGKTPFSQQRFSGAVALTLRKPGFVPEERRIEVGDGESVPVHVELTPEPSAQPKAAPPRPTLPPRRPRWRLAVGGILLGAGVVIGGFGVSGLYVDGKCYSAAGIHSCTNLLEPQYHSGTLGGALLGTGLGLSLIGSGMIAWPPSRSRNTK